MSDISTPDGLTLVPTVVAGSRIEDDYIVRWCGAHVGRIMLNKLPAGVKWEWMINIPLPIPGGYRGLADSLEEAKEAFRGAWRGFHASTSAERLATAVEASLHAQKRWG